MSCRDICKLAALSKLSLLQHVAEQTQGICGQVQLNSRILSCFVTFPLFSFSQIGSVWAFKVSLRSNLIICNLKHNAKNKNFKEMPWTKAQKVEFFCDYKKLAIKAYVGKSKINSAKKCLGLLRRLWWFSVWANLASVDWRILNFTFLCTNWLLDFEDLTEINRAWLHKDAKLAQPGRHQSRMQEVPCLILSGGNFFCWNIFVIFAFA